MKRGWWKPVVLAVVFAAICIPAFEQLYTLGAAIAHRIAYPYDLEWMEGGLLVHAQRIRDGFGIYGPPSVDFIPYLYTPLYPALLAMFGPSYVLGRAISVASLVGIGTVTFASLASRRHQHATRIPAVAGAILALGLFAAAYPFTKAWYDLVRADTFFLYAITAGISGMPRWARTGRGLGGHARVAAGAAILALAFFAKQTGILYVALGGAIVLVLAWRRAFVYAAVAGVLGLGLTALFDGSTNSWFWTYTSRIHRAHDFNMDRFWGGFGRILWQYPIVTIIVGVGVVVTAATWIVRREFPKPAGAFVLWTVTFLVSTLVGTIGIATEWSVENAFIPAFLHGALAAGAAVSAIYGCARLLVAGRGRALGEWTPAVLGGAVALALAWSCWSTRWSWRAYAPTDADIAAGDKLVARLAHYDGLVWVPSHPWYGVMAGKQPFVHRMGIKDVTRRQPHRVIVVPPGLAGAGKDTITGLADAIDREAFAAIALDNVDLHDDFQEELAELRVHLRRHYHPAVLLPADERPRGFSGSTVTPESIWVPSVLPKLPPGQTRVFDFEDGPAWPLAWKRTGGAWGYGPVTDVLDDHHLIVAGFTGKRFASSLTGGNAATGRLTSPSFTIPGDALVISLGGGVDATKLRVELVVDGTIVGTASPPAPGGDQLRPATIDTRAVKGQTATLVFVDDSPTQHLVVDDVIAR